MRVATDTIPVNFLGGMTLRQRPTILLWASEVEIRPDLQHIMWFDQDNLGRLRLSYGYLSESQHRVRLGYTDGKRCFVRFHETRDRLTATMLYVWSMTTTQRQVWRWLDLSDSRAVEHQKKFFKRVYGSRHSGRCLYRPTEEKGGHGQEEN